MKRGILCALVCLLSAIQAYAVPVTKLRDDLDPDDAARAVAYQNEIVEKQQNLEELKAVLQAKIDKYSVETDSPSSAAKVVAFRKKIAEEEADTAEDVAVLRAKLAKYQTTVEVPQVIEPTPAPARVEIIIQTVTVTEVVTVTEIVREVGVLSSPEVYKEEVYFVKVVDVPARPGYWLETSSGRHLEQVNDYYVWVEAKIVRTWVPDIAEVSHMERRTRLVPVSR